MNTFSIKEAVSFGWDAFKKDPWFYAGITLALTAISFIINMLTNGSGPIAIVGFLISLAASTFITIAYGRLALSVNGGTHAAWKDLWAPERFWNMLGTTILQGVIILIGLVLLIIPGIVACLMLSMAQLSVVDKNLNPIEAIKESYRLTKGHLLQLLLLVLLVAVMNIVGAVLLLVGLLVSIPVSLIAIAHVYKKLNAMESVTVVAAPTS